MALRAVLCLKEGFLASITQGPCLDRLEVGRLLEAAPRSGPKVQGRAQRRLGAGLRAGEVVMLRISDIDSNRMLIRVEQGKGRKNRYGMLSLQLLELLRTWWLQGRSQGWLFPGRDPALPVMPRQLSRICHVAAETAGLGTWVSPHTLRHISVPSVTQPLSWADIRKPSQVLTRVTERRRPYGRLPLRLSHSSGASPIVLSAAFLSHAMNGRSNLKSAPHCERKNLRTFWVLRYDAVIGVSLVIRSRCQSKAFTISSLERHGYSTGPPQEADKTAARSPGEHINPCLRPPVSRFG
jgi:hypothetical protein